MKQLIVIVQPHHLAELRQILVEAGAGGLTVTRVTGYGAIPGTSWPPEYCVRDMTRLELLLDDADVERLIDVILFTLKDSPEPDQGKILVCSFNEAIRIRTGETGTSSIQ